jgi:hypothetical protein
MIRAKYLLLNGKDYTWEVINDLSGCINGEDEALAIRLQPCDQPELDSNLHSWVRMSSIHRNDMLLNQNEIETTVIPLTQVKEMLRGDFNPPWLDVELGRRDLEMATTGDLEENWETSLADAVDNVLNNSSLSMEELLQAMWSASDSVMELSKTGEHKNQWMRQHFLDQGIPEKTVDALVEANQCTAASDIGYGHQLFSIFPELQDAFVDSLNTAQRSTCTTTTCEGCSPDDVGYCRTNTSNSIHGTITSILEEATGTPLTGHAPAC